MRNDEGTRDIRHKDMPSNILRSLQDLSNDESLYKEVLREDKESNLAKDKMIKQVPYDTERMAELRAISCKLQKQTKSRKQVEEEIEWAKAGTRKAVSEMLKE